MPQTLKINKSKIQDFSLQQLIHSGYYYSDYSDYNMKHLRCRCLGRIPAAVGYRAIISVSFSESVASSFPFVCPFCIKSSVVALSFVKSKISSLESSISSIESKLSLLSSQLTSLSCPLPPSCPISPSKHEPSLLLISLLFPHFLHPVDTFLSMSSQVTKSFSKPSSSLPTPVPLFYPNAALPQNLLSSLVPLSLVSLGPHLFVHLSSIPTPRLLSASLTTFCSKLLPFLARLLYYQLQFPSPSTQNSPPPTA